MNREMGIERIQTASLLIGAMTPITRKSSSEYIPLNSDPIHRNFPYPEQENEPRDPQS